MIDLVESKDIEDIRYTKPEQRDIDFCRINDRLILVKVYGVQLGFFIQRRITHHGYKCHFYLSRAVRKFSTRILREISIHFSSSHSLLDNWYCIAERQQKEVRHFIYRVGFRLMNILNDGSRLYQVNFKKLLTSL